MVNLFRASEWPRLSSKRDNRMGASKSKPKETPVDPELARLEAELKAAQEAADAAAAGVQNEQQASGRLLSGRYLLDDDLEGEVAVHAEEMHELEAELDALEEDDLEIDAEERQQLEAELEALGGDEEEQQQVQDHVPVAASGHEP